MNFLHTFIPQPIAFSLGPVNIYWYGLVVVLGIVAGILLSAYLAKQNGLNPDTIYDLAFYLVIFGLAGARLYDVLLEAPYYLAHPEDVLKIWRGGLAIHGAIIAGALTLFFYARRYKIDLIKLSAILVPGLALGQAIGRWGNYFNQELFGRPTDLPWGVFISFVNRPSAFSDKEFFHPTFLYESLGCLALAIILLILHDKLKSKDKYLYIASAYFIGYSLLRFSLEFIRIDYAPTFLGLRWPQIMSLLIIIAVIAYDYWHYKKSKSFLYRLTHYSGD